MSIQYSPYIGARFRWFLMGFLLLLGTSLHASLTIVADGDSSYYDSSDFFSVSYDGSSGSGSPSLTSLTIDLRAGSDGNAKWDASDRFTINYGETTFDEDEISMEWVDGWSGQMTVDFTQGYFNPGDVFTFGYDTDSLSGNYSWIDSDSGGAFGYRDVGVTAHWSNGETTTGAFNTNNSSRSTAVLNVPEGTFETEFTANDIVANRGDEIPLNLNLSNNENTSDYYISGLIDGAHLTHGEEIGDGRWVVSSGDIASVAIVAPITYTGQFVLTINQDIFNTVTGGSSGTFGGGSSSREALSSANTTFSYDSSGSVGNGKHILTDVGNNANSSWKAIEDRNEPDWGYFLVGNADGTEKTLFKESIDGMSINTEYHLSSFVANIHPSQTAELSFRVNGTEIFSTGTLASNSGWAEFGGTYMTATNTAALFEIVSVGDGAPALDDILFAETFEDDMLVTIHDVGRSGKPMYYGYTFTNSNDVSMTVNFVDTLPSGISWDQDYEPVISGGLTTPTPTFADNGTTISLAGLVLPPGTTNLEMRANPPTSPGDYSNDAQVTVVDEDFHTATFTAQASLTVID